HVCSDRAEGPPGIDEAEAHYEADRRSKRGLVVLGHASHAVPHTFLNFSRLCAVQISAHSSPTRSTPRRRNWRKPRACLICPFTGSTISLRRAYTARPAFVRNLRCMRSASDSFAGMRPRGGGAGGALCVTRPRAM